MFLQSGHTPGRPNAAFLQSGRAPGAQMLRFYHRAALRGAQVLCFPDQAGLWPGPRALALSLAPRATDPSPWALGRDPWGLEPLGPGPGPHLGAPCTRYAVPHRLSRPEVFMCHGTQSTQFWG